MNLALFYDSETQGLPLWDQPSDSEGQPHATQIAAVLMDLETRKVHGMLDVVCIPKGWTIPEEKARINGITTEYAQAVGVPEAGAFAMLLDLWDKAAVRIGHNESFDARIVRIGLKRFAGDDALVERWKMGNALCTKVLSTPILNLPPTEKMVAAGRTHSKAPTLAEAYRHFTGKPLDGAHRAMADVMACVEVFFACTQPEQAEA